MRVLVLRPKDGARRTAARLAALGHEAICAPLIETVATGAPAPAGPFDALIATSAQALRFAPPAALAPLLRLPGYLVGERTGEAARGAGFANIAHLAPDAARLVEAVAAEGGRGRRFLYLAGRDRKPDLEDRLAAAGFAVEPWVVYEARALPALSGDAARRLRAGEIDAALHFSRRSAEIFCARAASASLAREARALLHVAISDDAAQGLSSLAPPRIRIAAAPDEARMLAQLG